MPIKEPEEEQVLRAFRACPKLSPDQAAELCPEGQLRPVYEFIILKVVFYDKEFQFNLHQI